MKEKEIPYNLNQMGHERKQGKEFCAWLSDLNVHSVLFTFNHIQSHNIKVARPLATLHGIEDKQGTNMAGRFGTDFDKH